jgi:lycopene cyclase domain-containing protein
MTYFGFLAIFLGLPLVILGGFYLSDVRRGRRLPPALGGFPFWFTTLAHVVVALVYTTPWDNYLVATGVWYYHPQRVTGITLGYVPIEEYTFFIIQTLVTSLFLHYLAVRLPMPERKFPPRLKVYWIPILILGVAWLVGVGFLIYGWAPGTYLGLILGWAIPPILLQLIFGGDILRYHWRLALSICLIPTLYLSLADSLAIYQGIWEIAPEQSLNIFLGGVLPLEEFVFFLATNTLISLGATLFLARQSHERMAQKYPRWPHLVRLNWEEAGHG